MPIEFLARHLDYTLSVGHTITATSIGCAVGLDNENEALCRAL